MSGAPRETDPRRFGAKEIHVVQDPLEPVLGDMFGRLCNAKQSLLSQHPFLANAKFHEHGRTHPPMLM